jgi:hypothetical protein
VKLLGVVVVLTACATAWTPAGCRAAEGRLSAKRVRELVALLGHDSWSVRNEASRRLAEMGPGVLPLLPDPDAQKDLEVAHRLRTLRPLVFRTLLPDSIRKTYPHWSDAFRADGRNFSSTGMVAALGREKAWPAMRAIIKWGQNWGAVYWTSRAYASRDPRWTGARWADYVRNSLKAAPNPSGESIRNSLWLGRDMIPRRNRTAAAILGAEMMASKSRTVRIAGMGLVRNSGDRYSTRKLLPLTRSLNRDEADRALSAIVHLRRGGPLPGIRDECLLELARQKLVKDGKDHKELLSVLPSRLRARLWPHFMKAFGQDMEGSWKLIRHEQQYDSDLGPRPWNAPEDRATLRPFLKDENASIRGVAAYLLGRWDDVASREARADMLKTETDPQVLRLIMNGISWHKTPFFIPALRPHLKSKEPAVLASAAGATGVCGDEKSILRLLELLSHSEYEVNEGAAVGLRNVSRSLVGNPKLRKLLKKKLKEATDDWSSNYRECAFLLAAVCTTEDLHELKKYSKKTYTTLPYKEACKRLIKKTIHRPPIDKADYGNLVGMTKAGNNRARQKLVEMIDKMTGHARLEPCAALLQLNLGSSGTTMLRGMLKEDYCGAPGIAAFTAGRLKRRELFPDIVAALDRSDAGAGTRIWALGQIGDRRAVHVLVKMGLEPRWVVERIDEDRAFKDDKDLHCYQGWHEKRIVLLVDVTAEALEKLTGHKVKASTPEKLAAGWKKWYAKHGGNIPQPPKPKWLLEIEASLKVRR